MVALKFKAHLGAEASKNRAHGSSDWAARMVAQFWITHNQETAAQVRKMAPSIKAAYHQKAEEHNARLSLIRRCYKDCSSGKYTGVVFKRGSGNESRPAARVVLRNETEVQSTIGNALYKFFCFVADTLCGRVPRSLLISKVEEYSFIYRGNGVILGATGHSLEVGVYRGFLRWWTWVT